MDWAFVQTSSAFVGGNSGTATRYRGSGLTSTNQTHFNRGLLEVMQVLCKRRQLYRASATKLTNERCGCAGLREQATHIELTPHVLCGSGLCLAEPYRMKRPQSELQVWSRTPASLGGNSSPFPFLFAVATIRLGFCLAIPPQISSTSSDSFLSLFCFLRCYSLLVASDCIGLALNNQGVHDYIACQLHYQTPLANMTHPQQYHKEQSSSFTITQIALGSPLQFEPVLGSQELDNLINNYVPGSAMPQQKRAQVVLEFLNSIDALSYTHPVSIRYRVPQVLTPQVMPRHTSMPSITAPSSGASQEFSIVKEETLTTSKSSGSLKRSREEAAPPNASSAKRLPGFSIMTKDGIDITDLASRGPKTKEQRDHAALMRKLKACAACKRSKQRVCSSFRCYLASKCILLTIRSVIQAITALRNLRRAHLVLQLPRADPQDFLASPLPEGHEGQFLPNRHSENPLANRPLRVS